MKEFPDFERYGQMIDGQKERLQLFRSLLLEYNKSFNLTSITEEKEIYYKHFLDSVVGERFFPQGARVCEVGSGAGFPSLPLKIVREDLSFTLIESTGKKCDFLRLAVEKLSLRGVVVLQTRAEEAGRSALYRESFDVCCARAVAAMNTLAEYCLPLVRKGGRMVAYKGVAEEEVRAAEKAIFLLGGKRAELHRYSLPEGYGERSLVVVEKEKQTPENYPRGRGKERSHPIL